MKALALEETEIANRIKLDWIALSIAATGLLSAGALISYRQSRSITDAILALAFAALLVPIVYLVRLKRPAHRKWVAFAAVAVFYGDEFLVHMMRKPDIYGFFRWGILFAGYCVAAFLFSRDRRPETIA